MARVVGVSKRGGFGARQAPETRTYNVLLSLADTLTDGVLGTPALPDGPCRSLSPTADAHPPSGSLGPNPATILI